MKIPNVLLNVHVQVEGDRSRVSFRDFVMEATYVEVVYSANDEGVLEVVQCHITGRRVLVSGRGLGVRTFQRHTPWEEIDRRVRDRADEICLQVVERVRTA